MKRMQVHINTSAQGFEQTAQFYATLFGAPPSKTRDNYAKWMLDDPRVNFVIEVIEIPCGVPGIHYDGIQVQDRAELEAMDPAGVRWQTFRSMGDVAEYGEKTLEELAHYNDHRS